MTYRDGTRNNMVQPCGRPQPQQTRAHTRTLDLAPALNENDGGVGDLTRKFLLAFSHWVFYFILNLFFFTVILHY
jgi:hypothetical protein